MRTLITLIGITVTFLSCSPKNSKVSQTDIKDHSRILKGDTIKYDYILFDTRKDTCSRCNYLSMQYPLIQGLPRLNDTLRIILLGYLEMPDSVKTDFRRLFETYAKDFVTHDDQEALTTADHNISIDKQFPGFLVLNFDEASSGGAHPNQSLQFLNWDTKLDEIITLNDIFVENYEERLTVIAEKIFRSDAGLSKNDKLENYHFENGEFALNNNFSITSKGISFYYNSYEIQAYVEGPTDLFIPYASIKHLLRPKTVVSQFINNVSI
jgi:hypothetical protein